jgi:hypothetical protein
VPSRLASIQAANFPSKLVRKRCSIVEDLSDIPGEERCSPASECINRLDDLSRGFRAQVDLAFHSAYSWFPM